MEEQRGTDEELLFLFPRWLQRLVLSRSEAKRLELHLSSNMSGRSPGIRSIFCFFQMHLLGDELENVAVTSRGLIHCITKMALMAIYFGETEVTIEI